MRKFLKNAGLPIGVFALAIAGAFATNAMDSRTLSFSSGQYYQSNDEYNCVELDDAINCAPIAFGDICTWEDSSDITHQIFAMEENTNTCTVVLRKNP